MECQECAKREAEDLARQTALQTKAVIRCQMIAECVNRLRIAPRVMVILYGYICWLTFQWFIGLGTEATAEQVAFASTIWAGAAAWFGFYVKSGHTEQPVQHTQGFQGYQGYNTQQQYYAKPPKGID